MKQNIKVIVLLVLLVGVTAYAFIFQGGTKAALDGRQKEARAFTTESVKVITASWSAQELNNRAHPLLLQGVKESGNSLEEYFKVLSQLGTVKQLGDCNFLNVAFVSTATVHYATASHLCGVEFSNGQSQIGVEVRQDNMTGAWKIVNFQVNSPFFSQKSGNPKEDSKKE